MFRNLAFGENTLALRLENVLLRKPLSDLRAGYANPFLLCKKEDCHVSSLSAIKEKDEHKVRPFPLWRRERDSNPRVRKHKLISSQPRYDHFDISP